MAQKGVRVKLSRQQHGVVQDAGCMLQRCALSVVPDKDERVCLVVQVDEVSICVGQWVVRGLGCVDRFAGSPDRSDQLRCWLRNWDPVDPGSPRQTCWPAEWLDIVTVTAAWFRPCQANFSAPL
jgi:hypothetical protein